MRPYKPYNNNFLTSKKIFKSFPKEKNSSAEIFLFGDRSAYDIAVSNINQKIKYSIDDINESFLKGMKQAATSLDRYNIVEPNSNKITSRRLLVDERTQDGIYDVPSINNYMRKIKINENVNKIDEKINNLDEEINNLDEDLKKRNTLNSGDSNLNNIIHEQIYFDLQNEKSKLESEKITAKNEIKPFKGFMEKQVFFKEKILDQTKGEFLALTDDFTIYDLKTSITESEKIAPKVFQPHHISNFVKDYRTGGYAIKPEHLGYFEISELLAPPDMAPNYLEGIRRAEKYSNIKRLKYDINEEFKQTTPEKILTTAKNNRLKSKNNKTRRKLFDKNDGDADGKGKDGENTSILFNDDSGEFIEKIDFNNLTYDFPTLTPKTNKNKEIATNTKKLSGFSNQTPLDSDDEYTENERDTSLDGIKTIKTRRDTKNENQKNESQKNESQVPSSDEPELTHKQKNAKKVQEKNITETETISTNAKIKADSKGNSKGNKTTPEVTSTNAKVKSNSKGTPARGTPARDTTTRGTPARGTTTRGNGNRRKGR